MNIAAVIFDMGGTLEDVRYDRSIRQGALPGILDVLKRAGIELPADHEAVLDSLLARNAEYKAWSEAREIELPPLDIWAKWNLRDFGAARERLAPIAEELAYLWEISFFSRSLRPDAASMLEALKYRGYRLGVISNTSSRTQVFRTLDNYGIAGYFDHVVLSSLEGVRKPARAIFDAAVNKIDVPADAAAYVGDTLSRDVIGAKRAGYALAIQIESFLTAGSDQKLGSGAAKPDYIIDNLGEIPEILDRVRAGRPR